MGKNVIRENKLPTLGLNKFSSDGVTHVKNHPGKTRSCTRSAAVCVLRTIKFTSPENGGSTGGRKELS